jgi:predicted ferric reductase
MDDGSGYDNITSSVVPGLSPSNITAIVLGFCATVALFSLLLTITLFFVIRSLKYKHKVKAPKEQNTDTTRSTNGINDDTVHQHDSDTCTNQSTHL